MRIDLDAKVKTRDGEDAGSVRHAVVHPATNEVTDFVITTKGFLGRDVLVPREEIERASKDGEAVRLQLTRDEFEKLPSYVAASYVVPPVGWVPPAGYGFPYTGYLWPAGDPAVYAGAAVPARPGRSYTEPVHGPGAAESPVQQEVEHPMISKGAVVMDAGGEDIGVVDDVRLDPETGRLTGVILRFGGTLRTLLGGGDSIEVSAGQIERIEEETVHLNVSKDVLAQLLRR